MELTCEKRKKDGDLLVKIKCFECSRLVVEGHHIKSGYSQVNSISRRTEGCSVLCLHNSAILGAGGESCLTKAG